MVKNNIIMVLTGIEKENVKHSTNFAAIVREEIILLQYAVMLNLQNRKTMQSRRTLTKIMVMAFRVLYSS